jgi:hypothetical protein
VDGRQPVPQRRTKGPAEFFLEHPAIYAVSLAGAGVAVGIFAARARGAHGLRRFGWALLFALEAAIFTGIVVTRERARRSAST